MRPVPTRDSVAQVIIDLGEAVVDVQLAGHVDPEVIELTKKARRAVDELEAMRALLFPEASA